MQTYKKIDYKKSPLYKAIWDVIRHWEIVMPTDSKVRYGSDDHVTAIINAIRIAGIKLVKEEDILINIKGF